MTGQVKTGTLKFTALKLCVCTPLTTQVAGARVQACAEPLRAEPGLAIPSRGILGKGGLLFDAEAPTELRLRVHREKAA
jgi:hypothetical protein